MCEFSNLQSSSLAYSQAIMVISTFYIKTFGCAMNYADSEKIHRILLGAGMRKVLDVTLADVVILNTCSVRQK